MMLTAAIIGGLLAGCTSVGKQAAPQKMKMTTEIPPGIATPDRLDTRLGTLTLFDGVPDKATAQKIYDNLDFQHGVQAFMSGIQIASMSGMRRGILEFGPPNTTALLFENLMDSKALWLTPNTTSVYMVSWLELSDEPMVIETPPDVLGIIDDHWFKYVADFGRLGPDKSKGGKFLILPPGYEGEIPDGYFVVRTNTYGNWVIWRGFQVDGSPKPAVETTKKTFRMYPLSQRNNPPKMNFINVSGKFNNTIHRMDYKIFEEINEVVQAEPSEGQDPEGDQVTEPQDTFDFVIIGAQKSGTTWWQGLLEGHLEIHRPHRQRRELHFFDHFWDRWPEPAQFELYKQYFPRPQGSLIGEKTPGYLYQPWVAPMLKTVAPKAKLIVLMRDPVERYVSNLGLLKRAGAFKGEVGGGDLGTREHRVVEAMERSRYAAQLKVSAALLVCLALDRGDGDHHD